MCTYVYDCTHRTRPYTVAAMKGVVSLRLEPGDLARVEAVRAALDALSTLGFEVTRTHASRACMLAGLDVMERKLNIGRAAAAPSRKRRGR
jgi:hypothetical protein